MKILYSLIFLVLFLFAKEVVAQTGKYMLTLDIELWDVTDDHSDHKCDNYYEIYAIFGTTFPSNNDEFKNLPASAKKTITSRQDLLHQGSTHEFWKHTITFDANEQFLGLYFYGHREYKNWGSCSTKDGDKFLRIYSSACFEMTYGTTYECIPKWGSIVTAIIEPVSINLTNTNGTEAISIFDNIKVNATTGFPDDVYDWKYNIYGVTSGFVDIEGASGDYIDIPVKSFGDSTMVGKNIYIHVDDCNGKSSNELVYHVRYPAPAVVDTVSTKPNCSGDMATFKMYFDRDLRSDEKLILEYHEITPGGTLDNSIFWNAFINPGDLNTTDNNSFELSLPAGKEYGIIFSGKIGDIGTVSYDTLYCYIPDAEPLTFSADAIDYVCKGGSGNIVVTAQGGTAPYTYYYQLNDAGSIEISSEFAYGESDTITELPGNYKIWVKDAHNCSMMDGTSEVIQYFIIVEPEDSLTFSDIEITHPSGAGSVDGEITINVSGGFAKSGTYEYSWDSYDANSISSPLFGDRLEIKLSDIPKGTYTLTVSDTTQGLACSKSATFSLYDPLIIESISKTDVKCYGENTGELEAFVSGGKEPYSYYWHDSTLVNGTYQHSTAKARTLLYAGDYTVTVSDDNGWETTQSITIDQPLPLSIYQNVTEPCIAGDNTGSIIWNVSGGVPPYICRDGNNTVLTPFPEGLYEYENLPAGTYTFKVEDGNGCTTSQQVIISDPPVLEISISQTPISCNNTADGIVVASPYGGRLPYDLVWEYDNGNGWTTLSETGNKIVNCQPGDYRVTVTDKCNASATSSATTLINPDILEIEHLSTKNNLCYGGAEGVITLNVLGGTSPYFYRWNDGVTTKNRTGLAAGDYTLTVTDAHSCTVSEDYTISEPASAVSLETAIEHTWGIGNSDGKLTVTAFGGTPFSNGSYNISVKKDAELFSPSETDLSGGEYIALYDSLSAGTYTIVVQDSSYSLSVDAGGCTAQTNVTIIDPTPITVLVNIDKPVTCNGDSDARLLATASGGRYNTPKTYSYQWYKLADTTFVPINYTEQLTGDLDSGIYKVTATDEANLVGESSPIEIVMPDVLEASYLKTDVSCYGGANGKINITISGGVAPYKSSWSNGVTTKDNLSLPAGTYTDTIRDANGCTIILEAVEIIQPDPIQVNISSFGPISIGGNDASVEISIEGGTPFNNGSYVTEWRNASNTIMPLLTDTIINGVYKAFYEGWPEGTYLLTVSDSLATTTGDNTGCIFTGELTLTDPLPIKIEITQKDKILCYKEETASISGLVSGGVPYPGGFYLYQWYTIDNLGLATPITHTDTFADALAAGNYFLEVSDYVGKHYSDTITISEPPLLQAAITSSNVNCYNGADGSATVTISGGVPPYLIKWNTGESLSTISNLMAGAYNVEVSDANNCTTTANIEISQPAFPLTIYYNEISNPLAAGSSDGFIDINVEGGTPPYTYSWTDSTGSFIANTEDISDLTRGTYTLTVTDANYDGNGTNSCIATETVFLIDPRPIIIAVSQTGEVVCQGEATGEITSEVSGGVKVANIGYYYNWFRLNENGSPQDIGQTDNPAASQLIAGRYYLQITDYNGIKAWSDTLEIIEPEKLQASGIFSNVYCHNGSDGFIQTSATGGTPPYSYLWENGETGSDRSNLPAGNYKLIVSDNNACDTTLYFEITQPEKPLKITVNKITKPLAYGYSDGAIDIAVEGGTPPYLFRWTDEKGSEFAATEDISAIPAGLYTITVEDNSFALTTDNSGCSINKQIRVNQPDPLEVEISEVASVQCFGEAEGVLQAEISGGVTFNTGDEYLTEWFVQTNDGWSSISDNSLLLENLFKGTYKIIVEDANGITNSASYILEQPDSLSLEIKMLDASCENGNDGEIEALVNGGTAPYSYRWSNGVTRASQKGIASGGYFVFVTDKNGCEIYGGARVEQPGGLSASVTVENTSCNNACNGSATINVEGGVPPYSYKWNSPEYSGSSAYGLCAGTYSVEISDQNGCRTVPVFEITEPLPMVLDLVESITLCEGQTYDAFVPEQVEGTSYRWVAAHGYSANTRVATLSDAGTYTVTATSPDGCTASASIQVVRADGSLDPEFVITTQAFTDNEIILVNTMVPMPNSVIWDLPAEASILEESIQQVRLVFYQEGTYELGMIVQDGECTAKVYKDLLVTRQEDMDDIGDAEDPFISEFVVYPNPSDGQFTARVVLKETAPIVLKLYSIIGNNLIFRHELNGQSTYEHAVNVSLVSGSYIVLLETAEGTKFKQIIIH